MNKTPSTDFKFCVQMHAFNVDRFILQAIENCAPYVEKIYIGYSRLPWTYRKDARDNLVNPTDISIIHHSKYIKKIEIIEGEWDSEEDQRNTCLKAAQRDGMDFMIIQDADEFYTSTDYIANIQQISENSGYDYYITPWCIYWKNIDWVIEHRDGSTVLGYPEFAVNCNHNIHFVKMRILSGTSHYQLDGLCHHLSYAMSDNDMAIKLATWGHSIDFDTHKWYTHKWRRWYPQMHNIHPIHPSDWRQAIPASSQRPQALAEIAIPSLCIHTPNMLDRLNDIFESWRWNSACCIEDIKILFINFLHSHTVIYTLYKKFKNIFKKT